MSTEDQNLDLETQALTAAGCETIPIDKGTGGDMKRRGLAKALPNAETGDVPVVIGDNRKSARIASMTDVTARVVVVH